MKKLILSAAIILGSFSTFAQTSRAPKAAQIAQSVEEVFTEIKVEEVPDAVKNALMSSQPEAIIEKAYVNEKKEFKLEIKNGDQNSTVYADVNGNWIKK